MSSEVENTAAVMALLTAANAKPLTQQEADELGKSEGEAAPEERLPTTHCIVHVTERFHGDYRRGGNGVNARGWRVQVRSVATIEDNAKENRRRVRDALEDQVVTVTGVESTPIQRSASDDPIRPDDGWYSGLSEYGYYQ